MFVPALRKTLHLGWQIYCTAVERSRPRVTAQAVACCAETGGGSACGRLNCAQLGTAADLRRSRRPTIFSAG